MSTQCRYLNEHNSYVIYNYLSCNYYYLYLYALNTRTYTDDCMLTIGKNGCIIGTSMTTIHMLCEITYVATTRYLYLNNTICSYTNDSTYEI